MSWLIFDAILGIVLVLAVVQGYRKGFVLTLCGFLAVFVAFFGAGVLSNALAGPVADAIRPVVEERLEQAMQKSLEEQGWSAGEGEQPGGGSQAPDPEDPAEVSWRSKLAVGIDFKTRDGSLATAELSYSPNPVGYVDWHSSSIGTLDENELSLKEFGPEDPDPSEPFFAWTFGEHPYARYTVHEKVVGGDWTTDTRVVDPFLFAHSSHRLQQDVFALAYLLRYLGPERGDRSSGYSPLDGPFNIEPRNQGFSDDYRSFGIGDFGRFEVLNQMLAQLEVPYEFEPRLQLTGPSEVLRSQASYRDPRRTWDLKDLRTGAPLHLDQVGYGVSQLLPVIDVCVHAREQVICVEEPELHLHPRLQAKLGNLFATSVLKRGNQVILETHSESILLRVRRLIRSGKLLPAEVAVLYVDNDQVDGTTVSRLRLGDNGELLDPWPTGFFDDSLQDILGITR